MSAKTGARKGGKMASLHLGNQVDAAIDILARRRAQMSGSRQRFAEKGFGNFSRHEMGSFGRASFLGELVPQSVKPVPVILGTVVGVGFNSAVSRVLESPKIGINVNPLLGRVLLASFGVGVHVLAKSNFTLGFMVGQFPGLIDAGVSAIMDMLLGESPAVAGLRGQDLGGLSKEALAELQTLRRKLESPAPLSETSRVSQVPLAVRAQAA